MTLGTRRSRRLAIGTSSIRRSSRGKNSSVSSTGRARRTAERDFDVTYTFQSSWMKGLQIKTRAALVDLQGTPGLLPDIRLILNWPLQLF
jgi:hypothetical protein